MPEFLGDTATTAWSKKTISKTFSNCDGSPGHSPKRWGWSAWKFSPALAELGKTGGGKGICAPASGGGGEGMGGAGSVGGREFVTLVEGV